MSTTGDIASGLAIGSLVVGMALAPFTAGTSFAAGLAAFEAFGAGAAVMKTGAALHADVQYVLGRLDKEQWIDTQVDTGISLVTARLGEVAFPTRIPGPYPFKSIRTVLQSAKGIRAGEQILLEVGGGLATELYHSQRARSASTLSSLIDLGTASIPYTSGPAVRKPFPELDFNSPVAGSSANLRQPSFYGQRFGIRYDEKGPHHYVEFDLPDGVDPTDTSKWELGGPFWLPHDTLWPYEQNGRWQTGFSWPSDLPVPAKPEWFRLYHR